MIKHRTKSVSFSIAICFFGSLAASTSAQEIKVEKDVSVPMRDGVILHADVMRPAGPGPFPTLVYRTPYSKNESGQRQSTAQNAVARGYAAVLVDVRGRYQSGGDFLPYQQEGKDGFDTIEWAAKQPWSNGNVGTWGLSYPGAVQWLAAMEQPPHLKAMVPAMTFSSPRNFFYTEGVFDLSWIYWIWANIAPDARVKMKLDGPKTGAEARAVWEKEHRRMELHLPLGDLADLKQTAPWYFTWLSHPPEDKWWDWCELRGKYNRTSAAVFNFSGWYDEAYGPEGATTNFNGLLAARKNWPDPKTKLLIGPWEHGIPRRNANKVGERDFGQAAVIDYDEMVLRWLDHYVRGVDNGVEKEKRVRYFVMGPNEWREADAWPPAGVTPTSFYLSGVASKDKNGGLSLEKVVAPQRYCSLISDPENPVTDPHPIYSGAHDYRDMAGHDGVLIFETEPLELDTEVTGQVKAEIFISVDAPDTDLWVRLMDVGPDGAAFNLNSPGLDVVRASYANAGANGQRRLLQPGKVYKLEFKNLVTSNVFGKGHRIRIQVHTAFIPHFSRNLHTGELESVSSKTRKATVTIHHDKKYPSRLILPVMNK
ncbi:MAG: CocE/NonD family hydrolase [Acidobacteria bacterium]|nr:CocE/NonD family hydrolase [Acidobacteriota bacterium]